MNVVFLSQRVPYPPDRGDRITTWHFLKHLLDRGAQVRIGCLAEEARDIDAAAELAKMAGVVQVCAPRIWRGPRKIASLRGLLTGEALTLPFFRSGRLQRQVSRWASEFDPDLVYVYSSSMAQYARHGFPFRIMQFAELDSDKWRQYSNESAWPGSWVYRREAHKLLEFERKVAQEFDVSFVVSDVEKQLFMEQIPGVEPLVLPNGVDVDHFQSRGHDDRHAHTLIFTGVMDYEPNVHGLLWFVRECWPQLRQEFPDAQLLVVGSRPTQEVRELADQDGITVTGRVPETPPYFDLAGIAIAPLHLARGVQNKVLEAMSMGLPVVTTHNAARGISDAGPDTLLVAENAEQTVSAIARLMNDPAEAMAIGARAAQFIRDRYRWERMYGILDRVLEERLVSWE